jgi:hypothetical protein
MYIAVLRIRDVYPGSRILIFTHPGSRIPDTGSRIPDPNTTTKERGEKKLVVLPFLCSHKFYKIVNYFSFEVLKKKIWANFQRILELFTKEIVKKLLNIWSWDPGSEIQDPGKTYSGSRIPDPGVKKAPDPGSGSATLVYCIVRTVQRAVHGMLSHHVGVTTMERLDCHVHPLLEYPRCPGQGLNLRSPSSQLGTLAKSYCNSSMLPFGT